MNFSGEADGVEYGGSVDLASDGLPRSIWGQTSSSVGGWNLKTRAEVSHMKYDYDGESDGVYVTVQGNDEAEETFAWGSGIVDKAGATPLKAGVKKVMDTDAGKIMVAPRYNFGTSTSAVVVGYENDDTRAYLTVEEGGEKNLLVEQKIDDDNSATIKAGLSGLIAATLTNESDLGSTTVTLTSDELDVEINKDGWVAGITTSKNLADAEPTVRFSKSLTFGV